MRSRREHLWYLLVIAGLVVVLIGALIVGVQDAARIDAQQRTILALNGQITQLADQVAQLKTDNSSLRLMLNANVAPLAEAAQVINQLRAELAAKGSLTHCPTVILPPIKVSAPGPEQRPQPHTKACVATWAERRPNTAWVDNCGIRHTGPSWTR